MTDPYSTHQNMLRKCVEATTGPVLELGVGEGSTPLLHELCAEKGRLVVSYDTDTVFFEMYRDKYQSALHEFNYIHRDDWDSAVIVRPDKPWSVVLVDHRPARRRQVEAGRVATMAEYVICHDTEPENDRFYRWGKAFRKYRWRFDDVNQTPHTTVLSNFSNLHWIRRLNNVSDETHQEFLKDAVGWIRNEHEMMARLGLTASQIDGILESIEYNVTFAYQRFIQYPEPCPGCGRTGRDHKGECEVDNG